MSLGKYLLVMFLATLLCMAAWLYVLFTIDPTQTSILGFSFFYASLGLSIIGLLSLLGFGLRKLFMRKELDFRHVYTSFRQAIFISLILTTVLILQSQRLFTWLNIGLLVVLLGVLEFFIISRRSEA